ncbi:MAG: hypothetical protein ABIH23_32230 [bacterium]
MNQQPAATKSQSPQAPTAPPQPPKPEPTFEHLTGQVRQEVVDNRKYVMVTLKSTGEIIQFPRLMAPADVESMLGLWEAENKYMRAELKVVAMDNPNPPLWVRICEKKSVTKVDYVELRGDFLSEPEVILEYMEKEAYRLLPHTYHDGKQYEKDKAGNPTARAREIQAAVQARMKTLVAVEAKKEAINAR